MSTSNEMWWLFVATHHEALLGDCTIPVYTSEAQALSVTHARICVYRTRAIKSVVYGRNAENELVSRIKMADYHALVSMGTLSETKPLYEKRLF